MGQGSIVNTSFIAAIIGGIADAQGAAYNASKGSVRSLTKHGAQWFAKDNIRVNSVHPGAVFTGVLEKAGSNHKWRWGSITKILHSCLHSSISIRHGWRLKHVYTSSLTYQ